MDKFELNDFFGMGIDVHRSDVEYLLGLVPKLEAQVQNSKVVKSMIKQAGSKDPIVAVAKRQQLMKALKSLLNDKMPAYDPVFYEKDVNTASDADRAYGAQDKLIQFAMVLATGKSIDTLERDEFTPNLKMLRDAAFKGSRFDKLWDLLSADTETVVANYRKTKKSTSGGGFFSKIFS
ncbi:MAG: hypothetical protein V2I33_12655 [Kangiellaceae bacterium]|jgi:hypothetical protein|nr:hypothetical protein [Kangiellaceae bacterium]